MKPDSKVFLYGDPNNVNLEAFTADEGTQGCIYGKYSLQDITENASDEGKFLYGVAFKLKLVEDPMFISITKLDNEDYNNQMQRREIHYRQAAGPFLQVKWRKDYPDLEDSLPEFE